MFTAELQYHSTVADHHARLPSQFKVPDMPMLARLVVGLFCTLLMGGCASDILVDQATLVGKPFPAVRGEGLDHKEWHLPADLAGKPALLLIGYRQNAQFDLDRWMVGLAQLQTPIDLYEVPTIEGLIPGLIANQIDNGMRAGIPRELWKAVITVYSDADKITTFTGTVNPSNGRIILLNKSGIVEWTHDRGFGPQLLLDLDARVRSLHP
ncbi:hypothetical protein D4Q85_00855 [bacterium]|nr:MAG: hypothetical protein D4Q85_00855 [bacterium]